MGKQIKWFVAETSVVADISSEDYPYCLGFNAEWDQPRVRIGFYDGMERRPDTGKNVFRFVAEPWKPKYDRPDPTHIAAIPDWPTADHDGEK